MNIPQSELNRLVALVQRVGATIGEYETNPAAMWDARAPDYDPGDPGALGENLVKWFYEYAYFGELFLDVGSGEGRIYRLLREHLYHYDEYYMCDISPLMAKRCRERNFHQVALWDGITLPFENEKFDWVISFAVLLHVHPSRIEQMVAEHARVSRGYMFVSTWTGEDNGELSPHCFWHDYDALWAGAGLRVVDKREFADQEQTQWLLTKQ